MTFYNYEFCYILGQGKPELILRYFDLTKNKGGEDFILDESILLDRRYSALHRAQYLGIASLRNYSDYADKQKKTLSRSLVPTWIKLEDLKDNPLLTITETEIILNKE